ncbi:MAG: hypothetical protein V4599_00115 [Verrucomicrobiota bacterium]
MKSLLLTSALLAVGLAPAAHAQAPATPAVPQPGTTLTEAQVNSVMTQLKELETQILQMRGSNLSGILAKLREGTASDQAAMSLYLDCDNIVNSERKEVDKSDARKRQENMQRNAKGGNSDENGDVAFATRLGIQYLILTLEAHEAKEDEFKKMVPKLQEYINTVVAAAPKLKGAALNRLNNALNNNSPIVEAFNLNRYLNRKEWSTRAGDVGSMYMQTLLPLAAVDSKDNLPALWDARINAEGIFRKEQMFAPEFELWTKNELPALRWQRALYLYEKGPSTINALADMLKVIKENPSHPDAPSWVKTMRQMVNQSAPEQKSANLEPSASS